ncbi:MAG: single-stranded DNA-binding protein [Bacteroidota bacterium]
MKNGINKVTLVGNVGDVPRVKDTNENGKVAHFSLATDESYKDKEGKEIKRTEWHRVVAWDKRAQILGEYLKKGDPLYVEGKLRTSSWEDKEGIKRYSTDVVCDNFLFLSTKN